MKTMSFFFFIAFFLSPFPAVGQLSIKVAPGLTAPTGSFASVAGGGFAIAAGLDYRLGPKWSLTGSVAQLVFGETNFIDYRRFDEPQGEVEWSGTVVKGGLKYYYRREPGRVHIYSKGEVGNYRLKSKVEPVEGEGFEIIDDKMLFSGGIGSEKRFGPLLLGLSGTLNLSPDDLDNFTWIDLRFDVKLPLW